MTYMTIGALAEELAHLQAAGYGEYAVHFDFNDKRPEGFGAYRGRWGSLAIGSGYDKGRPWESEMPFIEAGYDIPDLDCCTKPPTNGHTVASLLKAADIAKVTCFEGYKGGEIQMNPDTCLYVADWGEDDLFMHKASITGLRIKDDKVILVTDR